MEVPEAEDDLDGDDQEPELGEEDDPRRINLIG